MFFVLSAHNLRSITHNCPIWFRDVDGLEIKLMTSQLVTTITSELVSMVTYITGSGAGAPWRPGCEQAVKVAGHLTRHHRILPPLAQHLGETNSFIKPLSHQTAMPQRCTVFCQHAQNKRRHMAFYAIAQQCWRLHSAHLSDLQFFLKLWERCKDATLV